MQEYYSVNVHYVVTLPKWNFIHFTFRVDQIVALGHIENSWVPLHDSSRLPGVHATMRSSTSLSAPSFHRDIAMSWNTRRTHKSSPPCAASWWSPVAASSSRPSTAPSSRCCGTWSCSRTFSVSVLAGYIGCTCASSLRSSVKWLIDWTSRRSRRRDLFGSLWVLICWIMLGSLTGLIPRSLDVHMRLFAETKLNSVQFFYSGFFLVARGLFEMVKRNTNLFAKFSQRASLEDATVST